jgi:hypothetical protein
MHLLEGSAAAQVREDYAPERQDIWLLLTGWLGIASAQQDQRRHEENQLGPGKYEAWRGLMNVPVAKSQSGTE